MGKAETTRHLLGKAGLGLAMFHLGRLGHEFVLTSDSSHAGDIWADLGSGPKAIEVKATTGGRWSLRREQSERVSWFILADVRNARCWLVDVQRILDAWPAAQGRPTKEFGLPVRLAAGMAHIALHETAPPPAPRQARAINSGPKPVSGKVHVVRKRLANGEIREYSYPR